MWNKLLPLRAEISSPLGLLLGPAQSGKLWTHQDVWQELMDAPCSCHHVPHFFCTAGESDESSANISQLFRFIARTCRESTNASFLQPRSFIRTGSYKFPQSANERNWDAELAPLLVPKQRSSMPWQKIPTTSSVQFMFIWNLDETY